MKVLFRTDASLEIGTGHVMRCLTLADALCRHGCECTFVCRAHSGHLGDLIRQRGYEVHMLPVNAPLPPASLHPSDEPPHLAWLGADWEVDAEHTARLAQTVKVDLLVIDHYALDARWENKLRPFCNQILVIDDLADRNHDCDFLLDQNLIADRRTRYTRRVPPHCALMLGPTYALLQPQYHELHDRIPLREGPVRRALIYFGGADTSNLTGMAISACLAFSDREIDIDVVANAQSPHIESLRAQARGNARIVLHEALPSLASLMVNADLAIGASGATSWERCSLGLPSLVISLAENQKPIAAELSRRGFIQWLGHKNEVTEIDLIKALKPIIENGIDPVWSERCSDLVDGMGTRRVSEILTDSLSPRMVVKLATRRDESNFSASIQAMPGNLSSTEDGLARKSDVSTWFRQVLRDIRDSHLYMMETQEGVPLGWVLFRRTNAFWEIASNFGTIAMKLGVQAQALQLAFREIRMHVEEPLQFKAGWHSALPIWLAPAVSTEKCLGQRGLSITICSGKGSWIDDSLSGLIFSWLSEGNDVAWVNSAEEAPGGDLCFYLSYGRIVKRDIRSRYTNNLVVHASDLPKGRGWSPMNWLILEGASAIPVTLLEADDEVDAGVIYLQEWIHMEGSELSPEWRATQNAVTFQLCRNFVENYPTILSQARPQTGEPTRYARRRTNDSQLDPSKSIAEQFNLLRIVDNEDYPAFFVLNGTKFVLLIEKSGTA